MTKRNLNNYFHSIFVIIFFNLIFSNAYAESTYDQKYLKWKAEQQKQDARLTDKLNTDANHYLSKADHLVSGSKIRLNSASTEQLMQLSGVGQKKAEAIVNYRKQKGRFNSIEELQNVKGIGPALIAKNKDKLAL